MVDFTSYLQHCPSSAEFPPIGDLKFTENDNGTCDCGTCMANERLRDNQKLHYDRAPGIHIWEDTQYLICPPRVLGYHLKSKRWVELSVELVMPIQNLRDPASFQKLELPKTKKELIEQLVECHASGKDDKNHSMTDLMQGKGNGLVILLHGIHSFSSWTATALTGLCRASGNVHPTHFLKWFIYFMENFLLTVISLL